MVLNVSVRPEVGYVIEDDVETSVAMTSVLLASYILMNRLLVGRHNWKGILQSYAYVGIDTFIDICQCTY